jgi:hypothetical protein
MGQIELYTKAFKVVSLCSTMEQAKGASRYLELVANTQLLPIKLHQRLVDRLLEQIDRITSAA